MAVVGLAARPGRGVPAVDDAHGTRRTAGNRGQGGPARCNAAPVADHGQRSASTAERRVETRHRREKRAWTLRAQVSHRASAFPAPFGRREAPPTGSTNHRCRSTYAVSSGVSFRCRQGVSFECRLTVGVGVGGDGRFPVVAAACAVLCGRRIDVLTEPTGGPFSGGRRGPFSGCHFQEGPLRWARRGGKDARGHGRRARTQLPREACASRQSAPIEVGSNRPPAIRPGSSSPDAPGVADRQPEAAFRSRACVPGVGQA